jgi:hypothetical protein
VAAVRRRALELLLELDPQSADANWAQAVKDADVFVSPRTDGVATLGADLPAERPPRPTTSSTSLPRWPSRMGMNGRSGRSGRRSSPCCCAGRA